MNKQNILDVLFYARNTEIGKLKKSDQEFLELIQSSSNVDSEFAHLDENLRKQIKDYVNDVQSKMGLVLSQYDEKYYKYRLV